MVFSIPRSLGIAAVLVFAAPLLLQADAPSASEKLEYVKPDSVGAARTRVDPKKTRGLDDGLPPDLALLILSPEHTGLTVQEHPSIFWYLNEPLKAVQYTLSITKDGDVEPIYEKKLDPEKDTGIQRLNLNDIAKGLEPDAEYQVVVAIIRDPAQHSKDVVASARIKRIPASEKLLSRLLTRPTPAERAIVYARQGIWYDALAAISDQIAADPTNKSLHQIRADLLKKVELKEAAAYDEKLAV